MRKTTAILLSILAGTVVASCNDDSESGGYGSLAFTFHHFIDGEPAVFNVIQYTNAAGNEYEVTEVQWFISDITLKTAGGSKLVLDKKEFAHYVDTNPNREYTLSWTIPEKVPAGEYVSISMTFGIKGEKNKHYIFPDQPESSMEWPIALGGENGGYHYMKLNGFWKTPEGERKPFNFHLGVGQERNEANEITGFVQNWFEVELANSGFKLEPGKTATVSLAMNIEEWFVNPHVYDHNQYGGAIMHNQEAMGKGCENGKNGVFEITAIVVQ